MKTEEFLEFYATFNENPHVIHFRKGTAGGTNQPLCHPFLIDQESPLPLEYHGDNPVLFHNGIWDGWKDILIEYYLGPNCPSRTANGRTPGCWRLCARRWA